jgi:poly-gamma-glutamate capsule biosynthesis protein CapA/YwtB (metallophosphatase superfamily)
VVGDVNFAGYPKTIAPFAAVTQLLSSDLRVANAEGLLTDTPVAAYREARLDITAPSAMAAHFRAFDLIGLANNHIWDGGTAGLQAQLAAFSGLKLPTFGAAITADGAYAPSRYRLDGGRLVASPDATAPCVSVLGATLKSNRPAKPDAHAALAKTDEGREVVLAQVGAEHTRGCFVLVALHGGREGADGPDSKTRAFGLALLDAGADLVAAHHPHVLQGVELRRGARLQAIAWSLGNFVFRNRTPEKRQTAILRATLSLTRDRLTLSTLALLPVHSDDGLLPRPARPSEAKAITRRIADLSERYGTLVTLEDGVIEVR